MKILFVVQNYYPSIGGTQIFFQNLAEYCANVYGDEVTVLTTNSYFGPEKRHFKKIGNVHEVINNVKVYRFPFYHAHLYFLKKIIKAWHKIFKTTPAIFTKYIAAPLSPALHKAIIQSNAEIIFAGTSQYNYMLYPLYRDKMKNAKPFVFQGAVHFNENKSVTILSNDTVSAIQKSEYYIANTAFEKDRLVEMNVLADNIIIGGSAVDMDAFADGNGSYYRQLFGLSDTDILIGYIGRIEPTKSLDILLKSFAACNVKQANTYLVLAGYTSEEYAVLLKGLIEQYSTEIKQKIHFISGLTQPDKVNLFHALDLFVLPSVNESFGMVFLEAWSCKKPVIGTAIGAVRSVIDEGINGLLMQPGNWSDLAEKILQLITNKKLRISMGDNGYHKTKEQFTWPIVAEKYRNTFIKAKQKFDVQRRSTVA